MRETFKGVVPFFMSLTRGLSSEDVRRIAVRASVVGAMAADERAEVLARVRDLARTHPDLAGRPTFGFPYTTAVWRTTRR